MKQVIQMLEEFQFFTRIILLSTLVENQESQHFNYIISSYVLIFDLLLKWYFLKRNPSNNFLNIKKNNQRPIKYWPSKSGYKSEKCYWQNLGEIFSSDYFWQEKYWNSKYLLFCRCTSMSNIGARKTNIS